MTEPLCRRSLQAGDVLIDFAGRQWVIDRGKVVTIGRGRTSMVRLPDDDHLSRRAALLRVLEDCVLIRNDSQRKPLVVRPPFGEDRVVEPGAATTSLPFPRFELVFAGRDPEIVTVHVDASRLTPDPLAPDPVTRSPATAAEPVMLSGAQRRVLVALCAPLLVESGPKAVPATYAQIGERLGLRPQYVRNIIKSLRETLSGHGVAGLIRDGHDSTHDDFRGVLARWAIRGGWVTTADVVDGDEHRRA